MNPSAWAAGIVIPLTAAVVVSTAPVATAVNGAAQAPNSSTVSESLPARRAAFPLTITRTGGFAGFQDVLVVARDGRVTVRRRAQLQRCRLTPVAVRRVTTAASLVPWARITPDSGQARFPDDMVIMVRSPAGGPVRLENPRVGAVGKVFQELLTDIGGGLATSRMCKAA
jgi:hypothetical protein